MDPITQQVVLATAGTAADEATYVDDVFSTFLYEGNGSTQSIDNGIDLSGEGGLVWIKRRDSSNGHFLVDTERGRASNLNSTSTSAAGTSSANRDLVSFNNDGFTVGPAEYENLNGSGRDFVSWTFRKAPGFFDVVTWSGNSSAGRQISHNLGSKPGMIVIKILNSTYNWVVYHQSQGASKYAHLNSTNAFASASGDYNYFNGTEPTSTHFTVDSGNASARVHVNDFGSTYVAYVFAHDDQSFGTNSDEAIIKCGSYTGDGSESGNKIDLGFEPQWLMIKRASNTDAWLVWDTMRGMVNGAQDPYLEPNTSDAEDVFAGVNVLPTGFELASSTGFQNSSGQTYIYMAIRRPHKPPTAGTEVFAIDTKTASSTNTPIYTSNFPVDLALRRDNITSTSDSFEFISRMTDSLIYANLTNGENSAGGLFREYFARNNGWATGGSSSDSNDYMWMFRRAPGFFDVVAYSGSSSVQNIPHNLQVEPELMIIKNRSRSLSWEVYNKFSGNTKYLQLNTTNGHIAGPAPHWNQTTPTSTHFTVGTNAGGVNRNGDTHIAYLFASLAGISKVGSYSGTGNNINVDCGFTAGARFVLIKQTEPAGTGSTGDWYVYDTARGIVSGNDPYLLMNSNAAQVTSTDYIDPLNAGFTVTSSAPAALNTSGGTYLFLAIA